MKTKERIFFWVKIVLLGSAIILLVGNFADLLKASSPGCAGTGGVGGNPGIFILECVDFVQSLKETIAASFVTVIALLIDVIEHFFLREPTSVSLKKEV